jgi:hypothetical protein
MIGSVTFGVGAVVVALLVTQRLVFDQPLADRPALLLSCLLLVLGVQLFALGLLGELIIFTHAKDLKDYKVADIVDAESSRRDRDREIDRERPVGKGGGLTDVLSSGDCTEAVDTAASVSTVGK